MPTTTEVARVKREIRGLVDAAALDLRPGSKTAMSATEKRQLRSEIQSCIQSLDELAGRLSS
ncbi:MAG: hypothetical protein ABL879_09770 [Devosia sp.]